MKYWALLAFLPAISACMPPPAGRPDWLSEAREGAFQTDGTLPSGCQQIDSRGIGREIGPQELPALRRNLRREARCDVIRGPVAGREVDQSRTDSAVITSTQGGFTFAR